MAPGKFREEVFIPISRSFAGFTEPSLHSAKNLDTERIDTLRSSEVQNWYWGRPTWGTFNGLSLFTTPLSPNL